MAQKIRVVKKRVSVLLIGIHPFISFILNEERIKPTTIGFPFIFFCFFSSTRLHTVPPYHSGFPPPDGHLLFCPLSHRPFPFLHSFFVCSVPFVYKFCLRSSSILCTACTHHTHNILSEAILRLLLNSYARHLISLGFTHPHFLFRFSVVDFFRFVLFL